MAITNTKLFLIPENNTKLALGMSELLCYLYKYRSL